MDNCSQLVVGGHSFIPELGNDPAIDFDAQLTIVNACLDQGINAFDTTYEPERVALGNVLEDLGRRDEARVIAWNFFVDDRTGEYLVGPQAFTEAHLERLQNQLKTDHIDMLVVHPVSDDTENQEQTEIARSWVTSGHVGVLGTWAPGKDPATRFGPQNPYDFMVAGRNIRNPQRVKNRSTASRSVWLDQTEISRVRWARESPAEMIRDRPIPFACFLAVRIWNGGGV